MRASLNDGEKKGELSFLRWSTVNGGVVEVMAGQHRIHALRAFVQDTKAPKDELWWMCEFYDKDRLPRDLNIKLRLNRRNPSLPDSQAQIWLQLVSIEPKDAAVDRKLVDALRIGGEKSFPARRLVTLWNHEGWRLKITRWCRTRLGAETFNISTFEWMASLRIDEYWFSIMDAALTTLEALPLDAGRDLGKDDWNQMAEKLGTRDGRTEAEVEQSFYVGARGSTVRAGRLLATLGADKYDQVRLAIAASPELTFPDLKQKLRRRKDEWPTKICILKHVIGWIDPESAAAIDEVNEKARKKPLFREYLSTGLRKLAAERDRETYPAEVAVQLQQHVLDFVDSNLGDFTAANAMPLLDVEAVPVGADAYPDRFKHVAWGRLLRVVRKVTDAGGQTLRPAWQTAHAAAHQDHHEHVHKRVQAFCQDIFELVDSSKSQDPAGKLIFQRRIEEVIAT